MKCIRCGLSERMRLPANNRVFHLDMNGKPVRTGFYPKTEVFSIFCEECVVQVHKRRKDRRL